MAFETLLCILSLAFMVTCRLGSILAPSTLLTTESAQCLLSKSYTTLLVNAYMKDGTVDPNALSSISAAREAGFNDIDIYFAPCIACEPDVQAREIVNAFKEVKYGKIWIQIGSKGWREFPYYNRRYLKYIIDELVSMKKQVGIITSKFEWEDPFRKTYQGGAQYVLMYKSLDKDPSFKDFVEFGGWTKPEAKLFESYAIQCGMNIDLIYKA